MGRRTGRRLRDMWQGVAWNVAKERRREATWKGVPWKDAMWLYSRNRIVVRGQTTGFERFKLWPKGGPFARGAVRPVLVSGIGSFAVLSPGRERHDIAPFAPSTYPLLLRGGEGKLRGTSLRLYESVIAIGAQTERRGFIANHLNHRDTDEAAEDNDLAYSP